MKCQIERILRLCWRLGRYNQNDSQHQGGQLDNQEENSDSNELCGVTAIIKDVFATLKRDK